MPKLRYSAVPCETSLSMQNKLVKQKQLCANLTYAAVVIGVCTVMSQIGQHTRWCAQRSKKFGTNQLPLPLLNL